MRVAEEWEEMEEYSQQQMSQLTREVSSLTSALSKLKSSDNAKSEDPDCQTEGCDRPIDWYCRYCKGFICTRCSKKPCGEETQHQSEDFEEMYETCKSRYNGWKDVKEKALNALSQRQRKLEEDLASEFKKMSVTTPEQLLSPELAKIVTELPVKRKLLEDVTNQVKEAEATFHAIDVDSLSHQEFIKVFEEFELSSYIFEVTDLERITLSEKCEVVTSRKCYAMDVIPSGELLLGCKDGFEICDKKGNVLRSIQAVGDISSIQYYKSKIYTLLKDAKEKKTKNRQVIVFDLPNYTESARWQLSPFGYMSMLAVNNDKVYAVDSDAKKVTVYSLTGEELNEFHHSKFIDPMYMSSCPPDGVLVSDWKAGTVYKIDCDKDNIAWQFEVREPRGVFCDKLGNIWVWDRKQQLLTLRSSDGKQTKSFSHKQLIATGVNHITGFGMTDNTLWLAAHDKGVLTIEMNVAATSSADAASADANTPHHP